MADAADLKSATGLNPCGGSSPPSGTILTPILLGAFCSIPRVTPPPEPLQGTCRLAFSEDGNARQAFSSFSKIFFR